MNKVNAGSAPPLLLSRAELWPSVGGAGLIGPHSLERKEHFLR
jgi:hypothetical protein